MNRYYRRATHGCVTSRTTPKTMPPLLRPLWNMAGVSEKRITYGRHCTTREAKNEGACKAKVLHFAGRGLRRANRPTKHATGRHEPCLPGMQRRIEMLVPNKRRVTRHQQAKTKKPTTEEMQIMSKNVCHRRKFTPMVLRGLGTLKNSPHITRKIKATTAVNCLGSFFQGRNLHRDYPITLNRKTQKLIHQNTLNYA